MELIESSWISAYSILSEATSLGKMNHKSFKTNYIQIHIYIEPDEYLLPSQVCVWIYYCVNFSMIFLLASCQIYPEIQWLNVLFPWNTAVKAGFKLSTVQWHKIMGKPYLMQKPIPKASSNSALNNLWIPKGYSWATKTSSNLWFPPAQLCIQQDLGLKRTVYALIHFSIVWKYHSKGWNKKNDI